MPAGENSVAKRLRWYWQMEAGNALFVPAAAVVLVWWAGGAASVALAVAAIACSALLVIGALYWRAVLRQIEGASAVMDYWLPRLAVAEGASLGLVASATVVTVLELLLWGWTASRIAAAALTVLAALEYVNYYRIQLQHFDNWADLKRLMTGRGFRKAHMARDISAWRRKARGVH
jgi:hypothetical protein